MTICKQITNYMCFLRGILFSGLWFIWTIFFGLVSSPILLLRKNHKLIFKIGKIWASITLFLLRITCGITQKVQGKIPTSFFIVAAKHQSAWETIFFLYLFKNPVFIIKKELTKIPIYGWYLEKMGMIAIDRRNGINALQQIKNGVESAMETHRPVIIFPEGTRTKPNQRVPYKSGIRFLHDTFTDAPIIPIALNSGKFWINKSIIKKPGTITVKILNPIDSQDKFLENLQQKIENESEKL